MREIKYETKYENTKPEAWQQSTQTACTHYVAQCIFYDSLILCIVDCWYVA